MQTQSNSVPASGHAIVVRPSEALEILGGCSKSRLYDLIESGELDSFVDGRARFITVASIHAFVARKIGQAKAA